MHYSVILNQEKCPSAVYYDACFPRTLGYKPALMTSYGILVLCF